MKIELEIKKIKERNKKVESDKAWEISITRKVLIGVLTYIVIAVFLWSADIPDPWLNAIIPAVAFVLSTLTLPFFKKYWIKKIYS
ncbi:hypothetical protein HN924_03565 [Candidatus Woesearchaeota archaeon]|jgi:hypothetical protein|nr:hypothetical protein [Candidatus Woesearchaeota archaeon]MBT7402506.1 hypothetical protein [Candidatus Woesearchaeota archaeon]